MRAPRVNRLEHWTLVSSDVQRSRRFYVDVLGADEPVRPTGPVSVNFAGTVIDFMPARAGGEQPNPGGQNHHHGYLIDLEEYDRWIAHLEAKNVEHQRATHGLGRLSIYVDDPDGYHIELFVLFPDNATGRREIEQRGLMELVDPARRNAL